MAFFEWGSLNSDQFATIIADCEKIKVDLDKLDLNVAQIYAKKCRKPVAELFALMKVGGWLTAKEALDWGFVDEITDIKSDPDMVEKFAEGMNTLIRQILGHSLADGDWAIVTSPKRHHKEHNFASLISARLAALLGVNFYEDLAECHSKHRVGAVFTFGKEPPKERNIIVFDDFVTTGTTMVSMKALLEPRGYNLVFFTGINNKA